MAVIASTNINSGNSAVIGRKWEGLTNGDVGAKFIFSQYSDKTVHIEGNFADVAVVMRGSNIQEADEANDAHWFTLSDALGLPAQLSANGGITLLESPLWISPKVNAGAGAAVNIHLIGTGE